MYKNILVPVDGSSHAEKALAVAAELARASGAALHLLTVSESPPDGIGILIGGVNVDVSDAELKKLTEKLDAEARKRIEKARGAVNLEGIDISEEVCSGLPTELIASKAASLRTGAIVMGSRGVGGVRGMMFGSVSRNVSHTAACSVITVT